MNLKYNYVNRHFLVRGLLFCFTTLFLFLKNLDKLILWNNILSYTSYVLNEGDYI